MQRIKAMHNWDNMLLTLTKGTKENLVNVVVETTMSIYMAIKAELLNAMQKRINEGYEVHVSV